MPLERHRLPCFKFSRIIISPRTFFYTANGHCDLHATKLGSARNYKTNTQLETQMDSLWRVALFARQIGKAVGARYLPRLTTTPGLKNGSQCIKDALAKFDYTFGYDKAFDFRDRNNLKYLKQSLIQGKPVFIFGYPISEGGKGIPLYNKLHSWVIHGYKTVRTRTWTDYFYFDERGGLNKIVNVNTNGVSEYYCFNMGWGTGSNIVWMLGDTYTWQGHRYDRITFLAGIEPIHPPE